MVVYAVCKSHEVERLRVYYHTDKSFPEIRYEQIITIPSSSFQSSNKNIQLESEKKYAKGLKLSKMARARANESQKACCPSIKCAIGASNLLVRNYKSK